MRRLCVFALLASCAAGDESTGVPPDVAAEVAVDVADEADVTAPIDAPTQDATPLDEVTVDVAVDVALDADTGAPDASDAPDEVVLEASVDAPADVTPRPDAGVMGDSLPTGAIMFFSAGSCPDGWAAFTDAEGRLAVPTTGGAMSGAVRGVPLRSGEDRTHTHRASGSFTLGSVSYVGLVGGGNQGVGAAGDVSFSTTTGAASTGLPYVQLLVCRKSEAAVSRTLPLPTGMMMFFGGERCPMGFSQAPGTQGRALVGLPDGAMNGATFGGAPLGATDAPSHAHPTSAAVATSAHGIALASGCCGSGYARSGMYTSARDTASSEPDLPTITLLQCMKD